MKQTAIALVAMLWAGIAQAGMISGFAPTPGGPATFGIEADVNYEGGQLDVLSFDFTLNVFAGIDADGTPNGGALPPEFSFEDGLGVVEGDLVDAAFMTDLIQLLFSVSFDDTGSDWGDWVLVSIATTFDASLDLSQLPDLSADPAFALVDVQAVEATQAIPLPGALPLLAFALAGLAAARRRI